MESSNVRFLMRALVPAIVTCLLSAASARADERIDDRADDRAAIESVLLAYWQGFGAQDFEAAARTIHPGDLEELRVQVLPVFLAGLKAPKSDRRALAQAFFAGVPEADRERLSGADTFVQFSKLVARLKPDVVNALAGKTPEVVEVSIANDGSASATYRFVILDSPSTDTDRFSRVNGRWYLRLKEAPRDTAQKFRTLFAPGPDAGH